jgi:TRAP-type mannitol/chloroaromatic compound transport system substrate-binding protein
MNRRKFLAGTAVSAAAVGVAAPAIAQTSPEIRWRLTSSFPKSLDTIYGAAEVFARSVAEMTDNRFQIQVFAAGEIVPGLQAMQAVRDGTVESCHTASYYYVGIDPTFAFGTAMPFGLNSRMQDAWQFQGGAMDLLNEFYRKHNIYAIPAGNTGCQMGGWFRREIRTVQDLNGLKFRIGGYAGRVLQRLGAVPQQIAGGDIYPALERGTLDAAEWVGPYDDEKLGFNRVAPFYHYPGWWEGGAMLHNFFNIAKWNELPANYKAILLNASHHANTWMQARYDAQNPAALRRLVAAGTQLRPFSVEVMEACFRATTEENAATAAANADFKRVLDNMTAFRGEQYLWWQVAEFTFDSFMIRQRAQQRG